MPAPFSERSLTILATIVTAVVLVVGLFLIFASYAFSEPGTKTLIWIFIAGSMALFMGIKIWKPLVIGIAVIIILATQVYLADKFNWRREYIEFAQAGQPFPLEEYIEAYPTYEEYRFAGILKKPDWVRFNTDCIQPALANQPTQPRCSSFEMITRYYYIDLQPILLNHFNKMRKTAEMVSKGELQRRTAYAECIATKACATIPLLPKGVDAKAIDETSKDYIGIRQAFWSLVNEKETSPQACVLTPLCRALVVLKVVDPEKLPF